ncbi:MAG: C1 family peptidase [Treponema sp.]|nr:C1 family peptidase [Treponema sp.]MCL2236780.1 C1 family peptidase [Treponema sp.]
MLSKSKHVIFLSIFILAASLAFGQGRGAIFDEQYDNLPRRAELSARAYEGLPSAFSLRQFAPLPGDQEHYGTCVAWAASYAARTISESVALNRTNQTETTQNAFSVAQIYRHIRPDDPEGLYGAQIYSALDFMRDTGASRMLDIERSSSFSRVDLAYYRTTRNFPIADYVTLFSREDRRKQALITRIVKKSISEGRPVIIGMNTPDSFTSARDVWRPRENPQRFYYGHALCVVGYDDTRHGGAFEVLNSWGRKWGSGGYIWIPYNVFVDFVMEAYEIIENIAAFSDEIRFDGFVRMDVVNQTATRTAGVALSDNNFYTATETFTEGTEVSFVIGARESAYVYSFTVSQSADSEAFFAPVLMFPSTGVSALLNYSDSAIELPGENRVIQIGSAGTKYLVTLYAKHALDIQNIMRTFVSTGGSINKRLAAAVGDGYTTDLSFNENEAAFTATPENPRTVAAIVLEIKTAPNP